METTMTASAGATSQDIQFHYDIGSAFYALWLDPSMTYSCAMFEEGDDLATAQTRKLDYHLRQARVGEGTRLLDIGCGWGSLMARAAERFPSSRSVGLTLSEDQKRHIEGRGLDRAEVRLQSWAELDEPEGFDAAVSIGALEHFTRAGMSAEEKVRVYRDTFKAVRAALKPGAHFSLQTIAFERMRDADLPRFIVERIFPNSMLPRPVEIMAGADRVMEFVEGRNDGLDYARTCRAWVANLDRVRDRAVALVGETRFNEYVQYLRMSAVAFEQKGFGLLRLTFRAYE